MSVTETPTRLFGVAIANGFSSEVRVMSMLLRESPSVDAAVVVHDGAGGDGAAERVREISGATVHALDLGWRPPGGRAPRDRIVRIGSIAATLARSLPRVIRVARAHRPDVVYSSQQKWDRALAALVARVLRRPHVIHLHYIPGPWLGRATMRALRRRRVITVSEFIAERAVAAGADRARVTAVLNPIDPAPPADPDRRAETRAGLGLGTDTVVVGFVGRLAHNKGQIETIEALATIRDRCPAVRLVVVGSGDGDIREELEQLARDRAVSDRVVFTGRRSDVGDLLASFDVFAHPSYEDPCPLAVLEAQAAGLPVLAFDEGGISEIVADGVTGLLAPDRRVDELAARMQLLADDPERRATLGAAATRRASTVFAPSTAGRAFAAAVAAAR